MPITSILSKFEGTQKTIDDYNRILNSIKEDYENELKKIQEFTEKIKEKPDSSREHIEMQVQKKQIELNELIAGLNKKMESIAEQVSKYIEKKLNELSESASKGLCCKAGLPPESKDVVKPIVDQTINPLKESLKIKIHKLPEVDLMSLIPEIPEISIPTI